MLELKTKPSRLIFVYRLLLRLIRSGIARLNIYNLYLQNIYSIEWSEQLLMTLKPSALIFDHASTSGKIGAIGDRPPIKNILSSAKKLKIPTISLPHGVPLFLCHPQFYDARKKDYAHDKADFMVFQHKWWMKECAAYGLDLKKTSIWKTPKIINLENL